MYQGACDAQTPVVHSLSRGRLAYGGPASLGMRRTRQTIAIVTGLLGVLLIVRGVAGGVWPLSLQLIAGVALVVVAVLRWRMLG